MQHLQARQLQVSEDDRFSLLANFGHDLIGCVAIESEQPLQHIGYDTFSIDEQLALASRFSLSGVQPKLLVIREGKQFRLKSLLETSTHIAKLQSPQFPDLVENEFIATQVFNEFVDARFKAHVELTEIEGLEGICLCVKRFDRNEGIKIHFEEVNQCLNKLSNEKYDGTYEDMCQLMLNDTHFIRSQRLELFKRICLFILLGNTDAHFKNFGFILDEKQYWLTPGYDIVATALYPQFQTFAMPLTSGMNAKLIKSIPTSQVLYLGKRFDLSEALIHDVIKSIEKKLDKALLLLDRLNINKKIQSNLRVFMERRWNQLFSKIGK